MNKKNKLPATEHKLSQFIVTYAYDVTYKGQMPIRALNAEHARTSAEGFLKKIVKKLSEGQGHHVTIGKVYRDRTQDKQA